MKALIIIFLALLLASCNTIQDELTGPNTDLPDGEGFYTAGSGTFRLRYKVIPGGLLECELKANTTGWLAVGFNPSIQMKDANFIIGNVTSGIGSIRDDFGDSNSSHLPDPDLGGTSDVSLISATEADGISILRFSVPLNSGDSRDTVLSVGSSYPVIFASGGDDDLDSYHNALGAVTIRLRNP